ncbi:MAG: nucleotide exchange factor GrpE [Thermoplasmatota archaeon]
MVDTGSDEPEASPSHSAVEGPEEELREARGEPQDVGGEIADLKAQVAQLTDQLKRVSADFDNFRRRTRAEAADARDRAKEDVLRRLIVILDHFDRAMENTGSEEALYDGVKLIYRDLKRMLEAEGLQRINADGHKFDATMHEAVMREETDAYDDGTIIKELERGYLFRGRVLRAAKVKVATKPSPPGAGDAAEGAPHGG